MNEKNMIPGIRLLQHKNHTHSKEWEPLVPPFHALISSLPLVLFSLFLLDGEDASETRAGLAAHNSTCGGFHLDGIIPDPDWTFWFKPDLH